MARKRVPVDTDYAVKEYVAGRDATSLAKELGVSLAVVLARLRERSIAVRRSQPPRSKPRTSVPDQDVIALYRQGVSEIGLARRYKVSRSVIARVLRVASVERRTQSESERVKWAGMTPRQRRAQTAAAHAAVRGTHQPLEHRCRIALSIERVGRLTIHEHRLYDLLERRKLSTIPQRAIGPYNCDLGAAPVAVEIWGGHWHWGGRHMRRTPRRFRYLMNAGWSILVIHVTGDFPITDATAEYVCAYVKSARRNPSAIREYRVVRGAGELLASGRADDDEITIVWPSTHRRDLATGRYESVRR